MDMDSIYYAIILVSVISYALGVFLSYFEKKGKMSVLSEMGNAGFINIFGVNTPTPEEIIQQRALEKKESQEASVVDEEII